LIALVNGHGYLLDPVSRALYQNMQKDNQTCCPQEEMSGGLIYKNYYRSGDMHVCGNNGWNGYSKNTQLTGPIQKTYFNGANQTMTARFTMAHGGYFSIKICKLNRSSDIVSQECFDQEALKIIATDYKNSKILDNYNVFLPYPGKQMAIDMKFTVQLPEGLTCENCVLLWEWRQPPTNCMYSDGTQASSEDLVSGCASQTFRSCADVKIVQNPNLSSKVYVPNPVKSLETNQKFFQCLTFNQHSDQATLIPFKNPNTRSDPYKFTGAGLFCVHNDDYSICKSCRENCMTPDKVCPNFCYCRWYPNKTNVYQSPLSPNAWNS